MSIDSQSLALHEQVPAWLIKLASVAVFWMLLWPYGARPQWTATAVALAVTWMPAHRFFWIAMGSVFFWFTDSHWIFLHSRWFTSFDRDPALKALLATLFTGFALLEILHSVCRAKLPLLGRLHTLVLPVTLALTLALATRFHPYAWIPLFALGRVILYFSYPGGEGFWFRFSSFFPLWQTGTPFPFLKGSRYLQSIVAQNESQATNLRLRGLRLMAWAITLWSAQALIDQLVFGPEIRGEWRKFLKYGFDWVLQLPSLGLPRLEVLASNGLPPSFDRPTAWLIFWVDALLKLLHLTVWGHSTISMGRFFGFSLRRNTCSPLKATTYAEFWGRTNYYLKELILEVFFFPIFLRLRNGSRKLRLFTAAFLASFLGIVVLHVFRDIYFFDNHGWYSGLKAYSQLFIWASLTGLAIGVSMARSLQPQSTGDNALFLACRRFSVFALYAFIGLFDIDPFMRFTFPSPKAVIGFIGFLFGVHLG